MRPESRKAPQSRRKFRTPVHHAYRDFNSATTERRVKYTEILNFSLFSRHFAFNVHKHGYREKVLKTTRMVRLLVQPDCGTHKRRTPRYSEHNSI